MFPFVSATRRDFLRSGALMAAGLFTTGFAADLAVAETQIATRIAEAEQSHPLIPVLHLAAQSLEKMEAIEDYEAVLIKREMIGSELRTSQMQIKLREEPKSVYLKFVEPHAGREVIFQPESNGGMMLVHETGIASLVGTLEIDPQGDMAMKENRYAINNIGLRNLLSLTIERWLEETEMTGAQVKYYPNAKVGELSCKVVEVKYDQQPGKLRYQISRLYIDAQTDLPVRVQNYDFNPRGGDPVLIEDYFYSNLKTNVGLADLDFNTENPNYGY
jgi:Protein of unknown function (DUF1571)